MDVAGHVLVDHDQALRAQAFGEQPGHRARDVADVEVGAGVDSVGEGAGLVAGERGGVAVEPGGEQRGGAVAQGDDEGVGVEGPVDNGADMAAVVQALYGAVAAGDEHGEVREAIAAGDARPPASLNTVPGEGDDNDALADRLGAHDLDIERVETAALVRALVRRLPQRERTILALRFVHEKTQAEIGQALCISQMHVSRLLSRTLAQLQAEAERRVAADPEHALRELVAS